MRLSHSAYCSPFDPRGHLRTLPPWKNRWLRTDAEPVSYSGWAADTHHCQKGTICNKHGEDGPRFSPDDAFSYCILLPSTGDARLELLRHKFRYRNTPRQSSVNGNDVRALRYFIVALQCGVPTENTIVSLKLDYYSFPILVELGSANIAGVCTRRQGTFE